MGAYLIAVVNDEKARIFTLEPVEFPELESGPRIVELQDLINPEAMTGAQDRYSDSKTGRGTAPRGGPVHGYDDRREQHLDEVRRRFSNTVMKEIQKLAKAQRAGAIIVTLSASMRQYIYPGLGKLSRQGYAVFKVAKNMINFPPQRIHAHLADMGFVPEQRYLAA
ncbi:MAG: host attachment protein [Hyphomicrobiales bacterium]